MKNLYRPLAYLGLMLGLGVAGPAHAGSVADFYSGNTITLYIGYSAGGGYDAYGRTVARHMGKHIPGNPTIVAKNRPGAGSLVLANEVGNVLPKDGSAIAIIGRAQVLEPLYGNKKAMFNPREFNWLGSANNEVSVCVAWHETPVSSVDDMKTRGMIVGGTGPGADTDSFPRVLNNILGTKLRLVTGYPGGNDILLAMERGEVEGRCGYSYSSLKSRKAAWLKEGKVRILLQMSTAKHPEMPDVPFVMDLAESDRDREILTMVYSAQAMGRPFVAPPGLPADRVKALQDAFEATMNDPEFLADTGKQKLAVAAISGPAIQALVAGMYAQPQELVDAARDAKSNAANLKITKVAISFQVDMGEITEIKKGGRTISYSMSGGKSQTVSISGSRTSVKIGGQKESRKNLKLGMNCEVTYPEGAEGKIEAKEVSCK